MNDSRYRTRYDVEQVPTALLSQAAKLQYLSAQRRAVTFPPEDRLHAALGPVGDCARSMDAAASRSQRGVRVFDQGGDDQTPGFEMQAGIHGFDL